MSHKQENQVLSSLPQDDLYKKCVKFFGIFSWHTQNQVAMNS